MLWELIHGAFEAVVETTVRFLGLTMPYLVEAVNITLLIIIAIVSAYVVRHYVFSWKRLFSRDKGIKQEFAGVYLPSVSIIVPMHNEEKVAGTILERLVEMDYPRENNWYEVIVVNDGSTDRTGEIVRSYMEKHPYIKLVSRDRGGNGKASALNYGLRFARNEIVIVFDADYQPPRDTVKRLVAPLYNPEVGGVMGRVVPINTPDSFVTRMAELERTGGYQVDQQEKGFMGLIVQHGGTVGGFRRETLKALNGWREDSLTEDTDITFRMYLRGWRISYVNIAVSYEEAPATWQEKARQLRRWVIGHTHCMYNYLIETVKSPLLNKWQKIDGVLTLTIYAVPPLIFIGWITGILLYLAGAPWWWSLIPAAMFTIAYSTTGNFAVFMEINTGLFVDRRRKAYLLTPLLIVNFLFNVWVVTKAFIFATYTYIKRKNVEWEKTVKRGNGKNYYNQMNNDKNKGSKWLNSQRWHK